MDKSGFYLMQDLIVLLLWNADKLAVIHLGVHCTVMLQLLHGRRNPKTITTLIVIDITNLNAIMDRNCKRLLIRRAHLGPKTSMYHIFKKNSI